MSDTHLDNSDKNPPEMRSSNSKTDLEDGVEFSIQFPSMYLSTSSGVSREMRRKRLYGGDLRLIKSMGH